MNRKNLFALIFFALPWSLLQAQGIIETAVHEVERNNTSLAAIRSEVEAAKVGNRTGIFLSDPQLDLYLLNNPTEDLGRTNFHLVQPFDFPTLLGRRNQLSKALNRQADNHYQQQRQQILLEAHLLVVDLIYHNAMAEELGKRLQHASEIERSYQAMLDAGEENILAYNKARLNLFNARKALEMNDISRRSLQAELQAINGGKPIEVVASEFPLATVPPEFGEWVQAALDQSPVLQTADQALTISRHQERLAKASYLPDFSAGYMMEALPTERFAGFGMGISIPLWQNRNTIRHARLQTQAVQQHYEDLRIRSRNLYQGLYDQARSLQQASIDYDSMLRSFDNAGLLMKALDAGEISLIDYMLELGFYYEAVNLSLNTKRELHKVLARMEYLVF